MNLYANYVYANWKQQILSEVDYGDYISFNIKPEDIEIFMSPKFNLELQRFNKQKKRSKICTVALTSSIPTYQKRYANIYTSYS